MDFGLFICFLCNVQFAYSLERVVLDCQLRRVQGENTETALPAPAPPMSPVNDAALTVKEDSIVSLNPDPMAPVNDAAALTVKDHSIVALNPDPAPAPEMMPEVPSNPATPVIPQLNCLNVSSIDFQAGKTYIIESAMNRLVIDLKETVRSTKNPIITYNNHGGLNQLWTARRSQYSQAFNLLTMVGNNNILKAALTYDPARNMTLLRHLSDGVSQQWFMGKQCDEFVQIRSNALLTPESKCLTQLGSGQPLGLGMCHESDRNQLWHLNIVQLKK